jgi:RNA polymerase sigma-70 factor (ECF subfamily)
VYLNVLYGVLMIEGDKLTSVAKSPETNGRHSTATPDGKGPERESDAALAIRARVDRAAFGELYERYVRRIHSYHYYRCSNQADAEDLTARTFIRALAHIHRYTDRGVPFSAWLFRIAHNLVANWHRDNSRRPVSRLEGLIQFAGRSDDPVEQVEATEAVDEIRSLVKKLPPDRQQLIVMKFASRMTNAQVAAVMGRTEGAIKALLHRTITSLRKDFASMDKN